MNGWVLVSVGEGKEICFQKQIEAFVWPYSEGSGDPSKVVK